jgi:cell division protein FtsL
VAKQYLSVHQKIKQLTKEKEELEVMIQRLFEKEKIEEISVSSNILKKEGEKVEVIDQR